MCRIVRYQEKKNKQKPIFIFLKKERKKYTRPILTSTGQCSTEFVFTHISAAHRHRQVGQFWSRADPEKKPAAHLHDVKMYYLLQNLLRKIVHRDAFTRRLIFDPIHFAKPLLAVATNDH